MAAPPSPDEPRRRSPGILSGFAVATGFLTRIPVISNRPDGGPLAYAAWAFPLVGAGIGLIAGFVFAAAQLLGLGDLPAALLAISAGLLLTGALHEDGLADTADGLGGGHDREQKLAIMRDSRVGSFGVLALVLSVGLRAAALARIGEAVFAGLALIAAHAASRGLIAAALRAMVPARSEGLGAVAGRPGMAGTIAAVAIGAGIAAAALGPGRGIVAFGLAAAAVLIAALIARRQLGGYTGDVLGALQQIAEIAMLLSAAVR